MNPSPTREVLIAGAHALQQGRLVAFPTETVYGLGANARSSEAVLSLYALKGRPSTNPLIVHVPDVTAIYPLVALTNISERRLHALVNFWPGPLTVVLPADCNATAPEVRAGGTTIACRIPNHAVALELLKAAQVPVAAPSANRSNNVSPTTAAHVAAEFGDQSPLILDGGSCTIGLESTVIAIHTPSPIILRPGFITREQIEEALAEPVTVHTASRSSKSPSMSPGMGSRHYSPRTTLKFRSEVTELDLQGIRYGHIRFNAKQITHSSPPPTLDYLLSPDGDLTTIAARLYDALRSLDQEQLDMILVDSCEATGIGSAVMDRLTRAVSRG